MQINPDCNTAAYTIRSYKAGEIVVYEPVSKHQTTSQTSNQLRINTTLITLNDSFIVTPEKLVKNWEASDSLSLEKKHFQPLIELKPELIIIGTGKKIHFPPVENYLFLQQQGIGVEIMDTSAACRTYNFLIADGRRVAAAMLMI